MITLKVSLRIPSIAPWLHLKQEFPAGQVDVVSNTLSLTLPKNEAPRRNPEVGQ